MQKFIRKPEIPIRNISSVPPKAARICLRQIIFLVPFIYILPILLEINGIFFAQPISDLLATALSVLLVLKKQLPPVAVLSGCFQLNYSFRHRFSYVIEGTLSQPLPFVNAHVDRYEKTEKL